MSSPRKQDKNEDAKQQFETCSKCRCHEHVLSVLKRHKHDYPFCDCRCSQCWNEPNEPKNGLIDSSASKKCLKSLSKKRKANCSEKKSKDKNALMHKKREVSKEKTKKPQKKQVAATLSVSDRIMKIIEESQKVCLLFQSDQTVTSVLQQKFVEVTVLPLSVKLARGLKPGAVSQVNLSALIKDHASSDGSSALVASATVSSNNLPLDNGISASVEVNYTRKSTFETAQASLPHLTDQGLLCKMFPECSQNSLIYIFDKCGQNFLKSLFTILRIKSFEENPTERSAKFESTALHMYCCTGCEFCSSLYTDMPWWGSNIDSQAGKVRCDSDTCVSPMATLEYSYTENIITSEEDIANQSTAGTSGIVFQKNNSQENDSVVYDLGKFSKEAVMELNESFASIFGNTYEENDTESLSSCIGNALQVLNSDVN